MKKTILCTLMLFAFAWAGQRAMTIQDLWDMKRIGDTALSPDGRLMALVVTSYDMEKNSGNADLWLLSTNDNALRQLTFYEKFDGTPRWKPDGSGLAFLSDRSGTRQIFFLSLAGGEARQMTHLPVAVEDFIWTPDGERFVFVASIFPDAKNLDETARRLDEQEQSKVKAHISDRLMYRVFDHWFEGVRSHIFVCDLEGQAVTDLTPGDYDTPPVDLGGARDYAVSPDAKELAFVRNQDPVVALSTNNDILLTAMDAVSPQPCTDANKATDNQPLYSPDGRFLAYRAMQRPGFEADRYQLMLFDRTTRHTSSLTSRLDRSVNGVAWAADSRTLFFTADNQGHSSIYSVATAGGRIDEIVKDHVNSGLMPSPDNRLLYFKRQSAASPDEIYSLDLSTRQFKQHTHINQPLLDQLALTPAEDFWFSSFDGKKVHGLLIKPPFFAAEKKYPLIYVIHGGPQGMSEDGFHYRWNPALFAAPGYVVAMVNFRGSTGYGQAWTDAVSKDWGGGPYRDLMAGIDYLIKTYPFIDQDRMAAAGGSYGGFMINWIATHSGRFKALVSHAGVFDQRSMYGATEELWFPEWEMAGTPYDRPELYAKWSPSFYVQNLKKFNTPTLVVHGEGDYRVPYTQGLQMFTALQRMGVPSRLLVYPDETHFVTKPQNARLWWNEVHGWIARWLR